MKYICVLFSSVFLLVSFCAIAQQNHFIYIQTDNKQPFYIKLDKKIFSSSASGYMVIPKLQDGNYNISIGFPNRGGEHDMLCTIDKKDLGYLLKHFGDKGWGLFNLQTLEVVMARKGKDDNLSGVDQTDAFSNMLSKVVNDPAIKQAYNIENQVIKGKAVKEEMTKLSGSAEKQTEDTLVSKQVAAPSSEQTINETTPQNSQTIARIINATGVYDRRSDIIRHLVIKNASGTELVYIDNMTTGADTITIFITSNKNIESANEEKHNERETSVDTEKHNAILKGVANKDTKISDSKFIDMELPNPNSRPEEKKAGSVQIDAPPASKESNATLLQPAVKATMVNSDCKSFASEEDFLKLRKRMAAEDSDEEMIRISRNSFKTKCYTVEQVKNLSVLFLNDGGKYAFFDTAYPFVSDSHNFNILQSQLSDAYYLDRFKVMIRH